VTPRTERDIIGVLLQDHHEVEGMFAELDRLRGVETEDARRHRRTLTEKVVIELVKHSAAEEAEVYPRIRERVDAHEAERLTVEQAASETTMKALEKLRPGQPGFEAKLHALMAEVREHVREEEQQAFPRMQLEFSQEELLEMGRRVEAVKKHAPTRPHPGAPDEPPADKLLGPLLGAVDRMRDALSGRGTEPPQSQRTPP
jgi:hemerythrin superfamily protein